MPTGRQNPCTTSIVDDDVAPRTVFRHTEPAALAMFLGRDREVEIVVTHDFTVPFGESR
jgi:hypothetical protein